jgi:hypothetical protein
MTSPGQFDQHTAAAANLEDDVADRATAPLRRALAEMVAALAARWVELFGDLDATPGVGSTDPIVQLLLGLLDDLPTGVPVDLADELAGAAALGAEQAAAEIGATVVVRPELSPAATTAVEELPARMATHIATAKTLARHGRIEDFADAENVVTQARAALLTAERTTRWATNRAVADGSTSVTKAVGGARLWVPERNACRHCLAYAGEVASVDAPFPAGLTFADNPLSDEPVDNPPLHPNCRCRITPWLGHRADGGDVDMPAALKREARRSVLLGVGPETESTAVRLRAADRLLRSGVKAPASVLAKSRRAVKARRFD